MKKLKAERILYEREPPVNNSFVAEIQNGASNDEDTADPRQKRKNKQRRRIVNFVNVIIILCLLMCIVITLVALWDYHRLDLVMGAGEIMALLGLWGGELLLIVVRQVLGSDVVKQRNSDEEEQ